MDRGAFRRSAETLTRERHAGVQVRAARVGADHVVPAGVAVRSTAFDPYGATTNGTSRIEQVSVKRGPRMSYATTRRTCLPGASVAGFHHSTPPSRNGALRR